MVVHNLVQAPGTQRGSGKAKSLLRLGARSRVAHGYSRPEERERAQGERRGREEEAKKGEYNKCKQSAFGLPTRPRRTDHQAQGCAPPAERRTRHAGQKRHFSNDQPNGNEVFTAAVGSAENLTIQVPPQERAVDRCVWRHRRLQAARERRYHHPTCRSFPTSYCVVKVDTISGFLQFNVACSDYNDLAGENCKIQLTDGTNPLNLYVVFSGDAVVELQPCDDNSQKHVRSFVHIHVQLPVPLVRFHTELAIGPERQMSQSQRASLYTL
ncbi:hypothetical protein C8R43DRAFT_947445 [Mycena crocata]|nr:hypothetical protein C8R43DRAFT_947445 [Mycena crocata]